MTEKTLKHELYKHGSYLHSLKESGSEFVNIDDEIKKNEELFQMASKKDHQPPFAVGEYYFDKDVNRIVKIENHETGYTEIKYLFDGKLQDSVLYNLTDYFETWKPAIAEQIATLKRAEHFASKGRKLDEFRVGDKIKLQNSSTVITVESITDKYIDGKDSAYQGAASVALGSNITLIQTAEELQEVADNE